MLENLFFKDVSNLLRVSISAPVVYLAVVAFVRLSGKRSTSQMNNFDWIVTVALGSLAASGIILKDVTLVETLSAIGVLLLFQYVLTRTAFRSEAVAAAVKAEPTLLVSEGKFLRNAMRKERVAESEILAAVRGSGVHDLSEVQWVVLETDAKLSVVPRRDGISDRRATALKGVRGFPADAKS